MENEKINDYSEIQTTVIMNNTGYKLGLSFIEIITSLAHLCIIGYVLFLMYLCFCNEVVLFTWHPILMGIGWALLMTEGILILSPHNIFTRSLSHKTKVQLHWILETVAVVFTVIGFIVVAVNKNLNSKIHFKSWHAKLGLVSTIGCLPTCVSGVVALYNISLKQYIKPANSKFIHRIFAFLTFFIGIIVVILSLYTHWYWRRCDSIAVFVICFIAITFSFLWSLRVSFSNIFKRLEIMLT